MFMNSTNIFSFPFQTWSDLDFLMTCSLHVHDEFNWLPFFSISSIKWFRFSNDMFITCWWWTQLLQLDFSCLLVSLRLWSSSTLICSKILLNYLMHNCVQLFFSTNVRFHIRHEVLLSLIRRTHKVHRIDRLIVHFSRQRRLDISNMMGRSKNLA
jgi:hypothetical protein